MVSVQSPASSMNHSTVTKVEKIIL